MVQLVNTREKTMENNDLLYLARGLGFDGEPMVELEKLCDQHNVSQDMREKMVKEYEEGYFDW